MAQEYEQLRKVQEGDVVIDAGATIGAFTVKASLQAGEKGFVYAFEPEPDNFVLLEENTKKLSNVKLFRKALWNSVGEKTLWITDSSRVGHSLGSQNTSLKPRSARNPHKYINKITVETVTLDEMINSKVDFLKMDIEASELMALQGAQRILTESKPFIAIEIHSHFNEVAIFLSQFGYQIHKRLGVEGFDYGTMYFR